MLVEIALFRLASFCENGCFHTILMDLFFVHFLFDRSCQEQPVHAHFLCLADSVSTIHCLSILAWIPIGIKQNDAAGTGQCQTDTACARRKQQDIELALLKQLDGILPALFTHRPIETSVLDPVLFLQHVLDHIQGLSALREYQRLFAIFLELLEHMNGQFQLATAGKDRRDTVLLQGTPNLSSLTEAQRMPTKITQLGNNLKGSHFGLVGNILIFAQNIASKESVVLHQFLVLDFLCFGRFDPHAHFQFFRKLILEEIHFAAAQ